MSAGKGKRRAPAPVAVIVALLALLLAGCGGGGGAVATNGAANGGPRQDGVDGGAGSIQEYGVEGSSEERAQASLRLRAYLDALTAHEWGRACSQLSVSTRKALERLAARAKEQRGSGPSGCTRIMPALAPDALGTGSSDPSAIRVLRMRVKGSRAYLVYEDGEGTPSEIGLNREGSRWGLADVAGAPQGSG